jgi:hypothetical protein
LQNGHVPALHPSQARGAGPWASSRRSSLPAL